MMADLVYEGLDFGVLPLPLDQSEQFIGLPPSRVVTLVLVM